MSETKKTDETKPKVAIIKKPKSEIGQIMGALNNAIINSRVSMDDAHNEYIANVALYNKSVMDLVANSMKAGRVIDKLQNDSDTPLDIDKFLKENVI